MKTFRAEKSKLSVACFYTQTHVVRFWLVRRSWTFQRSNNRSRILEALISEPVIWSSWAHCQFFWVENWLPKQATDSESFIFLDLHFCISYALFASWSHQSFSICWILMSCDLMVLSVAWRCAFPFAGARNPIWLSHRNQKSSILLGWDFTLDSSKSARLTVIRNYEAIHFNYSILT